MSHSSLHAVHGCHTTELHLICQWQKVLNPTAKIEIPSIQEEECDW